MGGWIFFGDYVRMLDVGFDVRLGWLVVDFVGCWLLVALVGA